MEEIPALEAAHGWPSMPGYVRDLFLPQLKMTRQMEMLLGQILACVYRAKPVGTDLKWKLH